EGADPDRHVDQEDPVPAGVLDEQAADDRAERQAGDRDRRPDAERAAALLRREGLGDQGERERHDQRRADPLQGPHRDQDLDALGEGGDQRGAGEDGDADQEPAPAAEPVTEAAPGDLERGEDEGV
ncbi:MAG: hypothetical protein AVDCRST_MAG49-1931, partial [uncultured Thermomicrobiales bacterium]